MSSRSYLGNGSLKGESVYHCLATLSIVKVVTLNPKPKLTGFPLRSMAVVDLRINQLVVRAQLKRQCFLR